MTGWSSEDDNEWARVAADDVLDYGVEDAARGVFLADEVVGNFEEGGHLVEGGGLEHASCGARHTSCFVEEVALREVEVFGDELAVDWDAPGGGRGEGNG